MLRILVCFHISSRDFRGESNSSVVDNKSVKNVGKFKCVGITHSN